MNIAPENIKERRHLYLHDPQFGMIVDAMCRMAVEEDDDWRIDVARDFFLLGAAVVGQLGNGDPILVNPIECRVSEEGKVDVGKFNDMLRDVLLLQVEGTHPVPVVQGGMLQNVEPWLEEWERAARDLAKFVRGQKDSLSIVAPTR